MMIKTFSASDWSSLSSVVDRLGETSLVKISSRGLMPGDAYALSKTAGDRLVYEISKIAFDSDCEYAHSTAMGCSDYYGCNRNGDGFTSHMLGKDHPSFEKFARAYRHHNNRDPDKSYGKVAKALYNDENGYVQLVMQYNTNKAACDKYGGLIADIEIDKLAKDGSFPTSMAVKIPHDVCVSCGNKAKTRKDYCKSAAEGGSCNLYGCLSGLTKIASDGRVQYVDNPHGKFYDNSMVTVGADRIAFAEPILREAFGKSASATNFTPGSAFIAEQLGLSTPYHLIDVSDLSYRKQKLASVAVKLAAYEAAMATEFAKRGYQAMDYDYGIADAGSEYAPLLFKGNEEDRASFAKDAASHGIFVPPHAFFKAAGLTGVDLDTASSYAPNMFRDFCLRDKWGHLLQQPVYCTATFAKSRHVFDSDASLVDGLSKRAAINLATRDLGVISKAVDYAKLTPMQSQAVDKYADYRLAAIAEVFADRKDLATLAIRQAWLQ